MSKSHLLLAALVSALIAWLFGSALSGHSSFVFRDAAHFYHPLFEWTRQEWGAGRVPLWNPYENLGVPLAAENPASVFYPGKLLFALPLDFTFLYNVYILGHVALAAGAAYALGRRYQLSPAAAILAALAYAFSGNVLFQCYNVVFLVGAAWLPLAVLAADRMLAERSPWAAVGLGTVLAMMILGGDAQMAYNAGLLAALAAYLRWRARKAQTASSAGTVARVSWRSSAPALLTVAALSMLALAAVQVLPSIEGTRLSVRGSYEAPRSLVELAIRWLEPHDYEAAWGLKWNAAILGRNTEAHQRQIYEFSVPPWRAVEFFWPNVSGRVFPTHRRWPQALGIEDRVWTPSLYMGLLPIVFAAGAWKLRKGGPADVRFLSWAVFLSAMASLGTYGWGWFAREIASHFGPRAPIYSDEVGGLYWLMTVVLPGYVYFRYPAKLLVITTLGIAMLGAKGWDALWSDRASRAPRALVALAVVSLVGLGAAIVFESQLSGVFQNVAADSLFGPFDAAGAWRDFEMSLGHAFVVATVFWCLLAIARQRTEWRWPARAALAVTIIELAISQMPLVALAPAELWDTAPGILKTLPDDRASFRVFRDIQHLPFSWSSASSPTRPREGLTWDRDTLLPKYSLAYQVSLANLPTTTLAEDYRTLVEIARGKQSGDTARRAVLDLLGVRFMISDVTPAGAELVGEAAEGADVFGRPSAMPRTWIVHDVEQLHELASRRPSAVRLRTNAIRYRDQAPIAWAETAVVESDSELPRVRKPAENAPAEHCRLVEAMPARVELDVRLAAPGMVVLSDLYYPGWTAELVGKDRAEPLTIYRTNRVMRGVFLEPGDHRLVFRYRPASVFWGAAISAISATLLIVAGLARMRQSRITRVAAAR